MINAFDTPARQAFVVEMVEDRADLPNAIALNSSMVNGSRIIGPSIGGALIAAVGEGWCFTIDAVSYLFVIASLLAMHVSRAGRRERVEAHVLDELRDGLGNTSSTSVPIRTALHRSRDRQHDGHAVHGADAGDRRRTSCTAGRTRSAS